uniref:Protein phosphatase 1 regulatory subunit 35 C-terminal domain-containing protein n=1 Tax=Ciona savignyi TaxID=51511 RepID=H2ZMN0_CIOSA
MDLFPRDLVQEKLVLDSKCYSLPELSTVTTPLDSVMSLYEHSLCWGLHNG